MQNEDDDPPAEEVVVIDTAEREDSLPLRC